MYKLGKERGTEMKKEVIDKAVNWWAEKIGGRVRHDNGDSSYESQMACLLADMGTRPITEGQLQIFKEELARGIEETDHLDQLFLGCDYGPCKILSNAAEKAGINVLNFPFKTNMCIKADKVLVSDGYAEPYVEI